MSLLVLAGLALLGFVEWLLAVRRAVYAAQGKRWRCSFVVLWENVLSLAVLVYVVRESSLWPLLAYSIGGGVGAWFGASHSKGDRDGTMGRGDQRPAPRRTD